MTKKYFGDVKDIKGEVHIKKSDCKGCAFCVEYCPRDVLVMSEEFNQKGYHPPVVAKREECCYCKLCEAICPEFAIFVTEMDEEEE
jgi:2-oxoglutarate ferredoxin oxidoreductase subunit delta